MRNNTRDTCLFPRFRDNYYTINQFDLSVNKLNSTKNDKRKPNDETVSFIVLLLDKWIVKPAAIHLEEP